VFVKVQEHFMQRTMVIAVAEVLSGGTKAEFYKELREMLDTCRRAANKVVSLCLAADTELMTGGKCPKLYSYKAIASEFPGICSVASSIDRAVIKQYRQSRYSIASGRKSACCYRSFPFPLLVSQGACKIDSSGDRITVKFRLKSEWVVVLAGGARYARQSHGIRKAVSVCDSKIWIDRKGKALVGVSCQIPEAIEKERSGTMTVQTAKDALLICNVEGSDIPFTINGDCVKQWSAARQRSVQRLSQDRKSGSKRATIKVLQDRVSGKWDRRFDSFCHEVSAQVVAHAKRRGVATVVLDFTVKSFCDSFQWFKLKSRIVYKCETEGIRVEDASLVIAEPEVSKPHVYFKLAPSTGRVKIGLTSRKDGGRHGGETDSAEELVLLAVENHSVKDLRKVEKRHHSYFAAYRKKGEWFDSGPVVEWLREVGWLGNAGNLSQIKQVLDV